MDICSYFRSASKSSVGSSSSDSEDGHESEIDVLPIPPMKHCSSSTSKPPSKSGSGRKPAESIYSALVEYCRETNIQLERLIGMGFDGAATFSGDKQEFKKG